MSHSCTRPACGTLAGGCHLPPRSRRGSLPRPGRSRNRSSRCYRSCSPTPCRTSAARRRRSRRLAGSWRRRRAPRSRTASLRYSPSCHIGYARERVRTRRPPRRLPGMRRPAAKPDRPLRRLAELHLRWRGRRRPERRSLSRRPLRPRRRSGRRHPCRLRRFRPDSKRGWRPLPAHCRRSRALECCRPLLRGSPAKGPKRFLHRRPKPETRSTPQTRFAPCFARGPADHHGYSFLLVCITWRPAHTRTDRHRPHTSPSSTVPRSCTRRRSGRTAARPPRTVGDCRCSSRSCTRIPPGSSSYRAAGRTCTPDVPFHRWCRFPDSSRPRPGIPPRWGDRAPARDRSA